MDELSQKNLKAGAIMAGICVLAVSFSYIYYFRQSNKTLDETPTTRSVEITYSFAIIDIPHHAKNICVWIPLPLNNDYQKLHDFTVSGDAPYKIAQETRYGNKFLVFDLSETATSLMGQASLSVKFHTTRYAQQPSRQNFKFPQLTQANLAQFLAPDSMIPIGGKIAQEARRIAGHVDDPFKKARLLYDHIARTLTYDKSGTGWGRGDAIYACDVRRGNCTDFHSLFIGEARSLNIPAKFIMGLPLPADESEGFIPGYHCWAQFYINEKGWLPIDASEASKFPEKKEMFFAGLDEHRVAFTVGRDIKLPGSSAEPLNFAIYPHVEIDGKTHDKVDTTFTFGDWASDT